MSKLVSFVGIPRTMDRLTTKRARLSYARVLVELSVKAVPPDFIPIKGPNRERLKKPVIYEHMLPTCAHVGLQAMGQHSVGSQKRMSQSLLVLLLSLETRKLVL